MPCERAAHAAGAEETDVAQWLDHNRSAR
jgi:hypothetical protein